MRLSTPTARLAVLLAAVLLTFQGSSGITRAEGCTIPPRFGPLVREIPQVVGQCLLNPTSDPSTGDIGQVTTNGELLMRGSDGIAQFTDATNGYLTWVAGPDGVVSRSQDERLGWEEPVSMQPEASTEARPAQAVETDTTNDNTSDLANINTVTASGGTASGGNATAQGGNSVNTNVNTVNPVINNIINNIIVIPTPVSAPANPTPIPAPQSSALPTAAPAMSTAKSGQWIAWGDRQQFMTPRYIGVATDGVIFVTDVPTTDYSGHLNRRIQKLIPTDPCRCWWELSPVRLEWERHQAGAWGASNYGGIAGIHVDRTNSLRVAWDTGSTEYAFNTLSLEFELRTYPSVRTCKSSGSCAINPTGIASDAEGTYVIRWDGIAKFGTDGRMSAEWGSSGSGPGAFNGAQGAASDGKGRLVVADTGNNRIQVLSTAGGRPIAQFGTKGNQPGQFDGPRGVAVDKQGNIFVADTNNHRIQMLSAMGEPLRQWGNMGQFGGRPAKGFQPGEFDSPEGIATDDAGNVYVADTGNHRIQKLILNP